MHAIEQIVSIARAEKPDAVIVAGDIYDHSNPGAAAMQAWESAVLRLREVAPVHDLPFCPVGQDVDV
ncbi:MAG: metallophosphoesterase [Planctomycetota bacterium]|nr:metallophosphoesterase [Planctomycetota bacterium]